MKRLLVTGGSGTLGQEVVRQALANGWEVVATYHTAPLSLPVHWHQLEIQDRTAVMALVKTVRPAAIIHTVAVQTRLSLWPTTADGTAYVALAAQAVDARLVHLSSDALFDGTTGPYTEQERPSPITPYGAAKAAAETAVAAICPTATIIRTSLIINRDPLDQHSQMVLDIITGRRSERLFSDEYRCPIALQDLATAVVELLTLDFVGILNVAGAEGVSRYELGQLVATAHGLSPDAVPHTTLVASGLRRPADVRLDIGLAHSLLKVRLRSICEYLIGINDESLR